MSAGSTSVTSLRNRASLATDDLGADNLEELGIVERFGDTVAVLTIVVGSPFALQVNAVTIATPKTSAHALGRSHRDRERGGSVLAILYSRRPIPIGWLRDLVHSSRLT
jgi:hypothetical protein